MKTIMQPAISLDGFIAKLDGDSYSWVNPNDEARYQDVVERCGCVLVGRKTYEEYIDDFKAYKSVTVYVCTNSHPKDKESVKYISGDPQELLKTIEQDGFSEVVICGGGEINGLFASAGLVDEIVVSMQPVVLGEGIPLFGSFKPSLKLELISGNEDIKGVTQNHYKVIK
jgi:dihydrofolate reductase